MKGQWIATPAVSARMSRIRSTGTRLEQSMRQLLSSAGIRFRSQPSLFGRPDFRLVGTKVVVFCDSSFWHGRQARPAQFARNRRLWADKFRKNVKRDRTVNGVLRGRGWLVLRFWDFEIQRCPQRILSVIRQAVRKDTARRAVSPIPK